MSNIVNPIGFLQEVCQKYKTTGFPLYNEVGSCGMDHCKEFTYECVFDGYTVRAKSRQKKQAKGEAAKAMVLLLQEKHYFDHLGLKITDDTVQILQDPLVNNEVKGSSKNPISALQEYCQKRKCEAPYYFESSTGNMFVCECKLNGKKSYGHGTTKKSAKTESAANMCKELGLIVLKEEEIETEPFHSEKHAISALQELCAQYDTSLKPVYEVKERFLDYYVVGCSVGTVYAEGRDLTKKGAKMLAANKVLGIITKNGIPIKDGCLEKINKSPCDEQDSGFEDSTVFLPPSSMRSNIQRLEELSLSDDDEDVKTPEKTKLHELSEKVQSLNLDDSVVEVEPSTVNMKKELEDTSGSHSEIHEEDSSAHPTKTPTSEKLLEWVKKDRNQ